MNALQRAHREVTLASLAQAHVMSAIESLLTREASTSDMRDDPLHGLTQVRQVAHADELGQLVPEDLRPFRQERHKLAT